MIQKKTIKKSVKSFNVLYNHNITDAKGKIKVGREHRNKARKNGKFKPNKDSRAKAGKQKHTPSKKHKGGKKSKGSNKKKR